MKLFYIEYDNGNCTVVHADSKERAREIARDPRFRITLVRVATEDDRLHFVGHGGAIR